jgi:hypothetical protein
LRGSFATAAGVTTSAPTASFAASTYDGLAGLMDGTYVAAKATRLATARSINGVAFDGTADITVSDATKVPTSRTVDTGTGLTGGGDLSANRTLAVTYGTGAGTAAEGNDARITGAAQKASNLSDLASAVTARTNLGLGDSAVRTAQSFTDSTLGGDEAYSGVSGNNAAVTLDCSVASVFKVSSPNQNITSLTISNPPPSGRACTITFIVQQGSTVRTVAAPSGAIWITPQPTQAASKACLFTYLTVDGGVTWFCSGAVQV